MTAKDTRGPAAYDGTAALKMDAPAAPTKPRWRLPRRKPTEKIEKSAKREKPPAPPQAAEHAVEDDAHRNAAVSCA